MSETFSFGGGDPRMKEVPAGTEAIFRFKGDPKIVETEWGDKYSFPISLISHPSHPLLADGPMEMVWESKSQCARQIYEALVIDKASSWHKDFVKAYTKEKWQLTRFDNGVYHISQEFIPPARK
jgi:hypothetical protein